MNNIELPKGFSFYNIKNKVYNPSFNLGDYVKFITDEADKEWFVYAYKIDIKGNIQYCISNTGNYNTADDYELEKIEKI